jgi:hypothetical protein
MHHPVEQNGAIGDAAGFLDPQSQDERPVIKRGARRNLAPNRVPGSSSRAVQAGWKIRLMPLKG